MVLAFDLVMLFVSALLYQNGAVGFDGVLIPTIALFSSFGPVIALANLGSTLQNTFAAGNRVLDILDETPVVEEVAGRPEHRFHRRSGGARHLFLRERNHPLRCVGGDTGTQRRGHCGAQRQRQIHAAKAAHAVLGRADRAA